MTDKGCVPTEKILKEQCKEEIPYETLKSARILFHPGKKQNKTQKQKHPPHCKSPSLLTILDSQGLNIYKVNCIHCIAKYTLTDFLQFSVMRKRA